VASTVALFRVPGVVDATAGSDALDAAWWPFDSLGILLGAIRATGGELYAAHNPLLATAHRRLQPSEQHRGVAR
jgi:ADP-ribose pyrophosphatase